MISLIEMPLLDFRPRIHKRSIYHPRDWSQRTIAKHSMKLDIMVLGRYQTEKEKSFNKIRKKEQKDVY